MKTKKVLSLALSFALLLSSFSGITLTKDVNAAEAAKKMIVYVAAEGTNATGAAVTIDKTPVHLTEGSNAETAIKSVLDASSYKDNYVITQNDWGASLDAIGDVAQTADYSAYWNFCVNGQVASTGISTYELKDQDQISLIYGGYPLSSNECSSYVNDTSKKPAADAQKTLLEQAKKQQTLLSQKIYEINFKNGTYIPGLEDTDSLYCVYSMKQAGFSANEFYQAVSDKLAEQFTALAKDGKFTNDLTKEDMTFESIENNKYVIINYTKAAMFLSAMGKDITNVGGVNLVSKITSKTLYEAANPTTLSRESMILFAMNTANAAWPADASSLTEKDMVNNILQDVDNQIDTSINWASYDSAAMAVQALAPYTTKQIDGIDQNSVSSAKDKVLNLLSHVQAKDGAFYSYGSSNAWSLAQTMITMGSFGVNPLTDGRFIKNGKTVFDISGTFVNISNNTVDENLVGGDYAYQPDQLLRGLTACINVAAKSITIDPPKKPTQSTTTNTPNKTTKPTKKITLKKPVIKKLATKKKKTLTVSFGKVSKATKYVIQISPNKKFKKNVKQKTVKSAKKVTFKKLKSKKTYYVRVRAFKGKTKSAYSKVKHKKVK